MAPPTPDGPPIDVFEEQTTVAMALHQDADKLDEEAAMLEALRRPNDATRSRERARLLRSAAVYLLTCAGGEPKPI